MKAKIKTCPKCTKKQGAKTRTCKKCGYKFVFQKIVKNAKKCPNCFIDLRPRAKDCICGHKFPIKKKGYEEIPKGEWRKLKAGDIFYIRKSGLGPYFLTKTEGNYPVGTKFLMGYRGQFKVMGLEKNGLRCYSNKEACCFIYMGKTYECEKTGIIQRRHKLWKKI